VLLSQTAQAELDAIQQQHSNLRSCIKNIALSCSSFSTSLTLQAFITYEGEPITLTKEGASEIKQTCDAIDSFLLEISLLRPVSAYQELKNDLSSLNIQLNNSLIGFFEERIIDDANQLTDLKTEIAQVKGEYDQAIDDLNQYVENYETVVHIAKAIDIGLSILVKIAAFVAA